MSNQIQVSPLILWKTPGGQFPAAVLSRPEASRHEVGQQGFRVEFVYPSRQGEGVP
jgi:hypothetical protein